MQSRLHQVESTDSQRQQPLLTLRGSALQLLRDGARSVRHPIHRVLRCGNSLSDLKESEEKVPAGGTGTRRSADRKSSKRENKPDFLSVRQTVGVGFSPKPVESQSHAGAKDHLQHASSFQTPSLMGPKIATCSLFPCQQTMYAADKIFVHVTGKLGPRLRRDRGLATSMTGFLLNRGQRGGNRNHDTAAAATAHGPPH